MDLSVVENEHWSQLQPKSCCFIITIYSGTLKIERTRLFGFATSYTIQINYLSIVVISTSYQSRIVDTGLEVALIESTLLKKILPHPHGFRLRLDGCK